MMVCILETLYFCSQHLNVTSVRYQHVLAKVNVWPLLTTLLTFSAKPVCLHQH